MSDAARGVMTTRPLQERLGATSRRSNKPKYFMRGFGVRASGVRELAQDEFDELASLFAAESRR
jgi:hypothetical protein